MKRVAITDVAAAAGVSRSTVSNYLNRPEILSPSARGRIARAIDELGFVPSDAARKISSGDTSTIGYVALEFTNPFSGLIADAIERRAIETGRTVMIGNSAGSTARQLEYLALFERKRVSGIIIATLDEIEPHLAAMRSRGTPSVVTGRRPLTAEQASVSAGDAEGGYLAARHLLEIGRRRLAFVGGPFSVQQVSERFDGASRAVREFPGASLSVLRADDRTMSAGFAAGVEMATRGDQLPDGVFAVNDLVGLGVVRGLTSFGVEVPRDVAVIGFDGDDIAAVAAIPLSTISTPGEAIGETAFDLLLHELGDTGRSFDSRQQVVAPRLIVRASTSGSDAPEPDIDQLARPTSL
ncbi:LacI family transcriptional regulator [Microbacterium terrae]|uniref:Ribose operon repressor n=1 Tax=Microbacterium terrae TaxID=69369 RepID=A0A0M2H497_9MICO|nr:LacI family DNA-binding transcriptional regulator [Microbacterium terrae]KJL38681.1 Ribose operon repressor [Microbacterium terrae]MBP1076100.1 LacI family transcriptional regulator [Microbacterium terrae]GLJ96920.1 LacI family transcriptional regulator [Microbacterium terrae]